MRKLFERKNRIVKREDINVKKKLKKMVIPVIIGTGVITTLTVIAKNKIK